MKPGIRQIALWLLNASTSFTFCSAIAESSTQAEAENIAAIRMSNITLPEAYNLSLWADATQTQDPAFFTFDNQGRMLVVEISRMRSGVGDVRRMPPDMTLEDIALESNEARLAMYQKYTDFLPMSYYTTTSDRIRLLEDTDQDNRADNSTLFASGFNGALDGLAAGIIERDNKIYLANIPHVWMLQDTNNDNIADKRESIQDGFGIRVGFSGHDMHGMTWGPDGKLYWSIGDRGYSLTTKEGNHIHAPNMGAIFRANPDGTAFEVFATGLRNPQELAFDHYGNLFTVDNDGDAGDVERIHHIIEGSDAGWHAGHQTLISFTNRLKLRSHQYTGVAKIPNSWMTYDMWKPRNDKHPAFILPTIGQIPGGPSGLTFNPGNNLGESWRNHFFVALYSGGTARSNITSFNVKPNGASFLSNKPKVFARGANFVDVDFGPDGILYASEYNYGGWEPAGKGAILTIAPKNNQPKPEKKKTQHLLTSPWTTHDDQHLRALLNYDHLLVRQRAQFELAKRATGQSIFSSTATDSSASELSRIHSIWGLGQIAGNTQDKDSILTILMPLLNDKNTQVRAQTARVLGDHRFALAGPALTQTLKDTNAQVRMYAAMGLGRMKYSQAVPELIHAIKQNQDNDLWLRHAYMMAMAGMDKSRWLSYKNDTSVSVRTVVLLALRYLKDSDITHFLNDQEQRLVNEAITAINDLHLSSARPALAKLLDRYIDLPPSKLPKTAVEKYQHHRLINANFNEGDLAAAKRLLDYAKTPGLETSLASEALAAIEGWTDINPIDTTTGLPSEANQQRAEINALVVAALPALLKRVTGGAMVQTLRLASTYNYAIQTEVLTASLENTNNLTGVRNQAFDELFTRSAPGLENKAIALLQDTDYRIRAKALSILYKLNPDRGIAQAEKLLNSGTYNDKQAALHVFSSTPKDNAFALKRASDLMQQLLSKRLDKTIILETLDLARSRQTPEITAQIQQYETQIAAADPLTKYEGALEGGNALNGANAFKTGGAGECMRCHRVNRSGGKAGPDLSSIGKARDRTYLLRALVDPGADIAPGYGTMTLVLNSGETVTGVYLGETPKAIELEQSKGGKKKYNRQSIKSITKPVSGMPPMNYLLNNYQLRDMVAYLETLKKASRRESH